MTDVTLPLDHVSSSSYTQEDIDEFAAVMGAVGRIHLDVTWATREHGGTVVPGVLVFAPALAFARRVFGPSWNTSGSVEVQYLRPTRPGDRVTTICRLRLGETAYDVSCVADDGTTRVTGEVRCANLPASA